jgi:hypothetical protein
MMPLSPPRVPASIVAWATIVGDGLVRRDADSRSRRAAVTFVHMSRTITIRADGRLRERLEKRAAASGKSLSALIREILENAVAERSVGRRAGHLKARVSLPRRPSDSWRRSVLDRNWRP